MGQRNNNQRDRSLESALEISERDLDRFERRLARKLNWGDSITQGVHDAVRNTKKFLFMGERIYVGELQIEDYTVSRIAVDEEISGVPINGSRVYNLLKTEAIEGESRKYCVNSDLSKEYHQFRVVWNK